MFDFLSPANAEQKQHPPVAPAPPMGDTPTAENTKMPAPHVEKAGETPAPHGPKDTPHAEQRGGGESSTPGQNAEKTAHGGGPDPQENAHGGGGVLPDLNQGGHAAWHHQPPFATELRQTLDNLMIQARLQAGAKKIWHRKPTPRDPQPSFDLEGGPLSDEALYQVDVTYLAVLWQKEIECRQQGLEREAAWVEVVRERRQRAMAQAMLPELMTLRERWAKAEEKARAGWPTPEATEKAYQAMAAIAGRIALLHERITSLAGGIAPDPLFPGDEEVAA